MKCFFSFILLVQFKSVIATGMPVLDAAQELRWALDAASAVNSLTMLTHEFTDEVYFIGELIEIKNMIEETQTLIDNLNVLGGSVGDIAGYETTKYRIFKEKVDSLVRLVRSVKSIIVGIQAGISSESVSTAVQIMREERRKLEERYQMKMALAKSKHESKKRQTKLVETLKRRKALLKDYREEEAKKNDWSLRLF